MNRHTFDSSSFRNVKYRGYSTVKPRLYKIIVKNKGFCLRNPIKI